MNESMAPEHSRRPRSDRTAPRSLYSTTAADTTLRPSQTVSPYRPRLLVPIILSIIALFLIPTAEAKDPVKDFCRRWGHASTVVDDRLYIDGGYVNWEPIGGNPKNYTNEWFLYHDLTSDAAGGLPPLVNLAKNNSVPNVIGGALWGDTINKWVYAFGGEVNLDTDAAPTGFSLFGYDILNQRWEELDRPDIYLNSPSWGGNAAVSEQGLGFYYGGWLGNTTVPGWTGPNRASDSLIVYDMDRGTWKNKTGPDNIGRAEGAMTYIPAGDNGFLVYFGGVKDPYGNGTLEAQPMDEIIFYDFIAEKWFTQKATGNVPDNRRRFCAGATWAEDHSSYNIYLYGGITVPPNSTAFDDVWILSIPSFKWLKWHPEPDVGVNGEYPHHSLTCNVVGGGSQMIIIGGSFPTTEECDSSPQYGSHNLMLGQQNPEKRKWETYNTSLQGYEVPEDIIAIVGGNAKGGATLTTPEGGFNTADLGVLITRTASASTRSATRAVEPDSGSSLSTGAIAGIAVGSAVGLIVALVVGFLCIKKHRKNKAMTTQYSPGNGPYSASDPFGGPGGGGGAGSGLVWSPGSSRSPSSPTRYYGPPAAQSQQHQQMAVMPTAGSYDAPVELPGAGNMNMGTWETGGNSPSLGGMQSPVPASGGADGKTEYVFVPVPAHTASHSSGHSHVQQPSPSSAGFPTNGNGFFAPVSGGYVPVSQAGGGGGSPSGSPTLHQHRHQRTMAPQELSTDPRGPSEERRRDEIQHQTYYHPTQPS